jgi:hypothetical protein
MAPPFCLGSSSVHTRQLRHEDVDPRSLQRDGDAVGRNVDPLDQQPRAPRLLGWEELVPHRLEREGLDDLRSSTAASSARRSSGAPQ